MNKKLDRDELTKENRYGIIEFTIDFIFYFGLLEEYIIPLAINVSKNELRIDVYELFCLSPYFDSVDNIVSSQDVPLYNAIVYNAPLEKLKFERI